MNILPVYNYLSAEERFKCRTVCREWRLLVTFPELGIPLTELLLKMELLTVQIFHIFRIDPKNCFSIATRLQKVNLLTKENITSIKTSRLGLSLVLKYLDKSNILNQISYQTVIEKKNLYQLRLGTSILRSAEILTENNFFMLAAHKDPRTLATCFALLHTAGILNDEIKEHLRNCSKAVLELLKEAFEKLQEKNMLTEANVKISLTHARKDQITWLIDNLP